MASVAPVLSTRNVQSSLEHYRRLGFRVDAYAGGGYGYLHWDDVDLHVSEWGEHDPARSGAQVYLYVSDADAPYDLREAAHVDPEGNLIRYGSWLPGHGDT